MVARRTEPECRRDRRRRLVRGLLLGSAAVGVPALVNALLARRQRPLPAARWGHSQQYAWGPGDIHFQRLGEGDPLLLLHSFGPGASGEEWREVAELLARRHQVHVPDLLGWGRSARPRRSYDGEVYLRLLRDFLADVVGRPATVVAAGLSAAYAVQTAVDHPGAVTRLALLSPLGLELAADEPDLADAFVHRLLRTPILGTSAVHLYTSRPALSRWLRQEVLASPERADAAAVDRLYRAAHQEGAQHALVAWLCGFLNVDVTGALARCRQPLWLGWGAAAVRPAADRAQAWLHHRPDARSTVFDASGALPHLEQPAAVAGALEPFLAP